VQFGNIPTEDKTLVIAVIEAVSQKIIEDTNKKLAEANAKLLKNLEKGE
jgi:hypothetical protein